MMNFRRYQHLERLGRGQVEGITKGKCHLFPKLDGTNVQVYSDKGEIKAGSRNRALSLQDDHAGFYAYVLQHKQLQAYLKKHPTHRLYGEWLVPHTLRTYRADAWRKFYIFDVCVDNGEDEPITYLPYSVYQKELEAFQLDYIAPLKILDNPPDEALTALLLENTYLIEEGKGAGEGVVIKNYDYVNKQGLQIWAKCVRHDFKAGRRTTSTSGGEEQSLEQRIAEAYITKAFVEKEYAKLVVANNGTFASQMIPRFLGIVWHTFIEEEMWHILKTYKNPVINFKGLNQSVTKQVKAIKPELFRQGD